MAVPIFEANNYGCGVLWVCFLMSMHSVQHGLINSCNFIADCTIVYGMISIAGLALATSKLATINLPEHLHQLGPDFFKNVRLGRNASFRDLSNTLGFQSGHFFTTMRLRTQFSATLA